VLFTLLDVSSIPHSLSENVTHPPRAICLWDKLSFLLIYHKILLTIFNDSDMQLPMIDSEATQSTNGIRQKVECRRHWSEGIRQNFEFFLMTND